jgi:hypothetical protein
VGAFFPPEDGQRPMRMATLASTGHCFGILSTRRVMILRAMSDERHFPPPWSVEELDSCFVVKDLNGQALAYMYFEKEQYRRRRREIAVPIHGTDQSDDTAAINRGLRAANTAKIFPSSCRAG